MAYIINFYPIFILVFILVWVSIQDIKTMTIPDKMIILGVCTGIIWVVHGGNTWQEALIGIIVGALPLIIIDLMAKFFLGKDGFGYGDVKLMAMAGIFIGLVGVIIAFFMAFVTAGAFGAYLLITKRAKSGSHIPFAPFLSFGIIVALILNLGGFL